ncbi:TetR/AcrR family transcriptional regulator [Actinokineospora bangkokensis]|uniref:HTH tetR-type domain-containing protein n=1 Tax=Actinokineospora bangkokensis TaxID=1193682 RepID=A0A1Q9LKG4_9PSEU|nr:TetR family transcriptional regulator [Actinokineospora bangkokensis]OLR92493.1 hypothetical protein BJP25_20705 [Actinokineospora bangkokensis]
MGNREDLLDGAVRCLKDKGWRSTVRDIAAAAGVNHAAIGYHFGSREALLTEAFNLAMQEWGDELGAAGARLAGEASPLERYRGFWEQVIASVLAHRNLWVASVEAAVEAERNQRVRDLIADAIAEARGGLAAGVLGVAEVDVRPGEVRSVGSVQMALVTGVLMQWVIDPDRAPGPDDLIEGLKALGGRLFVAADQ